MRNIIVIILLSSVIMGLLLPVSTALQVGDIFTQAQIDSANFDTFNLGCTYDGFRLDILKSSVDFTFSCFSIRFRQGTGDYIVTRPSWEIPILISQYLSCRQTYTRPQCINGVHNLVVAGHQARVLLLRNHLKTFQSRGDMTSNDFTFTQGEINP